jgi:hypothetical protein
VSVYVNSLVVEIRETLYAAGDGLGDRPVAGTDETVVGVPGGDFGDGEKTGRVGVKIMSHSVLSGIS